MKARNYSVILQERKRQELAEATQEGFMLAGALYGVALNNLYNFGAGRLEAVEKEAQRLWDEYFLEDMELAAHSLVKRLEQIRGKDHVDKKM